MNTFAIVYNPLTKAIDKVGDRIAEGLYNGFKTIAISFLGGINLVATVIFFSGFLVIMFNEKWGARLAGGGFVTYIITEVVMACL